MIDTIESLEARVKKYSECIRKLKELARNQKEDFEFVKKIEQTIEEIYK